MKLRLIRDTSLLILLFGSVWLVVTLFFIDDTDTDVLSIEKEMKIGEYFLDNLTQDPQFTPVGNTYTDSCLNLIANRLLDNLDSDYKYEFHIFNNSMINAFALPGGHIMISSGLIMQSTRAEETAAVLAHEMGHIEKKHLIGKLIKDLGLAILLSNDPFLVGEVSRTAASTAFDRRKEREADLFALELMETANIDPRVLGVFFRKLKDKGLEYDQRFEMMMTHPHHNSRIKMALEYKLPEGFEADSIVVDWEGLKNEIQILQLALE